MKPFQYYAIVKRIIDGDSIEVDLDLGFYHWIHDQNIRLKNLDAEEHRTSDKVEEVFGEYVMAKLAEQLPVGSKIIIETDLSDNDKFGRILGTVVTLDDLNVNQYMLDNHYAVPYEGQNKADIREQHLQNRQYLIENGEITLDQN